MIATRRGGAAGQPAVHGSVKVVPFLGTCAGGGKHGLLKTTCFKRGLSHFPCSRYIPTCLDRTEKDRRILSPVSMVQMSGRRRKIAITSSAVKCDRRTLRLSCIEPCILGPLSFSEASAFGVDCETKSI